MRGSLPTGIVTFFFSDMEGSTRLVQELGDAWPAVLEEHDTLIRAAVAAHRGVEVRTIGDAFFVVFADATDAVAAATEIQRTFKEHQWREGLEVRVRIGLHTGAGDLGGSDYVGIDVHRAARISAVAYAGQILVSEATASLSERELPEGVELRDLGKHRLKDLLEREALFQVVIPGVSEDYPPLRTLDAIPNNLPVQVTSFVGREDDVKAALDLLPTTRVLTLLGPGGTGKTRLAIQVAAEAADDFPDGVFFVDLAPVVDGQLIASTVLAALDVQVASGAATPDEQLHRILADKSILLVLDNFEQLVESSGVVSELAAASPASRFLVTSRVPLRIGAEQELPIPPLETVDPAGDLGSLLSNESVHLFVERAKSVRPDFEVTPENAQAVAELVNRLDGLPLAIELVVPKLKLLPVDGILERLDTRTLSDGVRDAPERHQTMWSAISWSEESLDPTVRRLFWHLSVFVGGARLEEIEKVCSVPTELGIDVIELLAVLIDHSLLVRDGLRFRMLQVIREFAAARLDESGEAHDVRHRHSIAYCERMEAAETEITRKDRKRWLEDLDADHDNLRAAFSHCVGAGEVDGALRLAWSLWRYWQIRGHLHEARRRVDEALALEGGTAEHRAKAIEALGGITWWQGDQETCVAAYEEALRAQRDLGDQREVANALYNLGLATSFFSGETERGHALLSEAMEIFVRLGDLEGQANVHWGFGNLLAITSDEPHEGMEHLRRCIELYRLVGNVFGEGWGHFELGEAYRRVGDTEEALDHLKRGLDLLYGSGEVSAATLFLMSFAAVASDLGDRERAVRLAGAAWGLVESSGVDLISVEFNKVDGLERESLDALEGDLADVYREGREMSHEAAIAYALEVRPPPG